MKNIAFRRYQKEDITLLRIIWNEIVEEGNAFPNEIIYNEADFEKMLVAQSAVTCILLDNEVAGYYILHPNHIGRCGHTANASYAISRVFRGKKLAEPLVRHSVEEAKTLGFIGMQFNAVVESNSVAIHTYQKIGFKIIGTVPNGYHLKDGNYVDMHIMYLALH